MGYQYRTFEQVVFQYKACQYTAAAAITVWVYDYLLTVRDELELLWSRNGLLIKVLYLIGRYFPIIGASIFGGSQPSSLYSHALGQLMRILQVFSQPGSHPKRTHDRKLCRPGVSSDSDANFRCKITFTTLIIYGIIQNTVCLVIFTMRLCAIFVLQPWIRRFLITSLVVTLTCLYILQGISLWHLIPGMVWGPVARTCIIPNYNTWALGATYLAPIYMECLIFSATIYHAVQYQRGVSQLDRNATGPILKTLYIDGAQYYFAIMALRLGSVSVFYFAPLGLQVLFCFMENMMSSTLMARYFLSFRRKILDSQESVKMGDLGLTGETVPITITGEMTDTSGSTSIGMSDITSSTTDSKSGLWRSNPASRMEEGATQMSVINEELAGLGNSSGNGSGSGSATGVSRVYQQQHLKPNPKRQMKQDASFDLDQFSPTMRKAVVVFNTPEEKDDRQRPRK
ncbi:hypothetical protein FRC16_004660 [Serendipita sp. 398]|nr:hypothetical protein FRC16_004660 [Serendipita sp. 398]